VTKPEPVQKRKSKKLREETKKTKKEKRKALKTYPAEGTTWGKATNAKKSAGKRTGDETQNEQGCGAENNKREKDLRKEKFKSVERKNPAQIGNKPGR